MVKRVIIGFIVLSIVGALSFLLATHKSKDEIVVKGSLQDWNLVMKAVKMSRIPHEEGLKVEDFLYSQVITQIDTTKTVKP